MYSKVGSGVYTYMNIVLVEYIHVYTSNSS